MQIYTKILIGMLLGALIGATLGPNSPFLERDAYNITDAQNISLRLDPQREASALPFPEGISLRLLKREGVIKAQLKDSKGELHERPQWIAVSFEMTEKLALKDSTGRFQALVGEKRRGEEISAWLQIKQIPLEKGGFLESPSRVSALGLSLIEILQPVGVLFLRLIMMVIIPLVFASLLVGVASLGDVRKLGRMGGKTLGLYLITTAIAITIGLLLAQLIQPGTFVAEADRVALVAQFSGTAASKSSAAAAAPSMIKNLLAFVPTNPLESLAQGDMLQIIFFATILGVALSMLPSAQSEGVIKFFDGLQHAMIRIIHMVMSLAPYGVAALIAEVIGSSGLSVLKALLIYSLVVILGLMIHGGLIYGFILRSLSKLNWWRFMRAIRPAQLIAFSTSSSSAALPVSIQCAEEELGISNSTACFVLPLGATINMDGTALYQGVAALFIAQVFQIDLSLGDQLAIVLAATMASIGAAGVPGAGMITLAMVLSAAGIPQVGLALILGMDRLLDMFRTAVNVTGDLTVTAVMAVSEGEDLGLSRDLSDPSPSGSPE